MSVAATIQTMEKIHAKIADRILARLESDDCSGTDVTNAIKFLRDSQIAAAPGDDGATAELMVAIKDVEDQDPDEAPHPF